MFGEANYEMEKDVEVNDITADVFQVTERGRGGENTRSCC